MRQRRHGTRAVAGTGMSRDEGWSQRTTPTKFLLIFVVLLVGGCRSQRERATTLNAASEIVVSSTPPFQTKEPERYRATRTTTIVTADGKTVITKSSIARDGEMRRNESETGSKKIAYLD